MLSEQDKKAAVGSMFDNIAFRYDFLNHFLSFGIDRCWRKKVVRIISLAKINPEILDVATGTGDLAIAALELNPMKIIGIDISEKMLEIGRGKINKNGYPDRIELLYGDSENIPFSESTFDVAMVAFGVRNFADPLKGLSEMFRVVRENGLVVVLEFSKPSKFPFRPLYNFYFLHILPLIGRFFSKNQDAYTYLPLSVMHFPDNEEFLELMRMAGLINVKQKKLTGGVASIYTGIKMSTQ